METPDFRSYFLIRIKLAGTVNDIHGDLLSTFPDSCPGLSTLQRWHTEFDKGVFTLEKKTRPGRECSRVKRLVEDNPGYPYHLQLFQAEDLGLRNLLSVLVSHQLSEANKTQRVKCCQDLLKLFEDHGENFLGSHLLVQDESWFYWDSAERRQVWAEPFSTPPCETDSEEDDDSDGVHLEAEAGIDHCTTCRDHTLSQPEKDKIRLKDCLLMWDNARPHTATVTREFLTRRDVEPVKQSPSSPDLNLFRKLKHLLREDEFGGHEEATLAVQRAMRRVSEDELYDQLRKLRGHCHDVIAVGGNYVY
ncbi:Uncharacterized protein FKW44_007689 [Caligus rogercresseyi]|uniref:Histone-lysine N-methyltransferase SETMAR n=1 Tax=Caligus rogercresseyi TaxID=217165 RepID=A0A7T8QTS4_CALRO|nr:Uncharacterized protein FKW44_007689 [Caligus rogercresseyi]